MTFVSYAQNYEDLVLWRALKDVSDGFYIDVGAADPKVFSVTHAFYTRGWHGINIEPTAEQFAALSAERDRDININALIGEESGIGLFYEFASLGLSTMNVDVAKRHIDAGISFRTVSLPTLSLTSVCEAHGAQAIHFLKIDVEGAEREVLRSMDFAKFRPWVVVVEATEPMTPISTKDQWEEILVTQKYHFAYFDGLNRYYVADEHENLIQNLSIPPNVFDDFIKVEELEFRKQAEDWRLRLLETLAASDQAHQRMAELDDEVKLLRASQGALEEQRFELIAKLEKTRQNLDQRLRQIGELEQVQQALLTSFSWRVSAPLRIVSRRFPGFARSLRMYFDRNPRLKRLIIGLARKLRHRKIGELEQVQQGLLTSFGWRVSAPLRIVSRRFPGFSRSLRMYFDRNPRLKRLITPLARKLLRSASPQPAKNKKRPRRVDAKYWIYLGDTIDWLEAGQQLTGVGKVTTELFFASLDSRLEDQLLPCVMAPNSMSLAPVSIRGTVAYIAKCTGVDREDSARVSTLLDNVAPMPAFPPAAGDHVLFTGVIWTEHYIALFQSLADAGIRFSVFVYDIIPILNPEFVDPSVASVFQRWLRTVLIYSECVFVSSQTIKDQILRWAVLSDIYVSAVLFPVTFGTNAPQENFDAPPAAVLSRVRTRNFCLIGRHHRPSEKSKIACSYLGSAHFRTWWRLCAPTRSGWQG